MSTFFSSANKRSYDDFKKQIPPKIQSSFDSLREFCLSLGSEVVEDVRMHRVVFGKKISFRWFADMEPTQDSIVIKIQKNRKEPHQIINVKIDENMENIKNILKDAFTTIR